MFQSGLSFTIQVNKFTNAKNEFWCAHYLVTKRSEVRLSHTTPLPRPHGKINVLRSQNEGNFVVVDLLKVL